MFFLHLHNRIFSHNGHSKDPITGQKLTDVEKGLVYAGLLASLVGASFLDEAADLSSAMLRNVSRVDDVADAAKASKAVSKLDEVADAAKNLGHVDEAADAVADVTRASRVFDELGDAAQSGGKYADDLDELIKMEDGFLDAATARRLDEATAPGKGPRRGALKQGDELRESLAGNNRGGGLTKRLEQQRVNQRLQEATRARPGQAAQQADELAEQTGGGVLTQRIRGGGDDVSEAAARNADEGPLTRRLNKDGCPPNSFTAGTLVQTDEGGKPIEEVEVGDKVLAEDPVTGKQGYAPAKQGLEVVALTNHPTDEVLQITIDSDEDEADNSYRKDNDEAQLNNAAANNDDDQQTNRPADQLATMEITPDHR